MQEAIREASDSGSERQETAAADPAGGAWSHGPESRRLKAGATKKPPEGGFSLAVRRDGRRPAQGLNV